MMTTSQEFEEVAGNSLHQSDGTVCGTDAIASESGTPVS
jgi:hypothetical protein